MFSRASKLFVAQLMVAFSAMAQQQVQTQKFLALGDSYTIGERVAEAERWPVQLAQKLSVPARRVEASIIATTGWRTDDLQRAIEEKSLTPDFDLVSLLIGVNNQYQGRSIDEYTIDFEELLKTAIRLARGQYKHVFVVSIPDYGYTPFGKSNQSKITAEIDHFNAVNEMIAEKYGVTYVNITDISRQGLQKPELIADDGLHPSGVMYSLWVTRILEEFRKRR